MTAAPTRRTEDFLDTIGVDTHLSYTDGGYANFKNVIADLKYLGITHARDSLVNPAHLATYKSVAASGIKFTLTMAGQTQTTSTFDETLSLAADLIDATPGSVQAMEGANEINNWPITFNGVGGLQGALNLQDDLYSTVHDSSTFSGVAVDYFTGYDAGGVATGPNPSTVAGLADYDNQHPYPINGLAPGAQINFARSIPNEPAGARGPVVFTETGYSSNGGTAGAVDQEVQAKYTLDLLFDAMKDGVSQTYLYDLLDAYAPGSKQGDDGYGLFDNKNDPKLAATAIHNLNSILADTGTNATSFTPGSLNATFSGLPSTGDDLILEKSNGTFDIVVWAEPQIWNKAEGSEIAAPSETVSVNLGQMFQNLSVFDPLTGASAISSSSDDEVLKINLTDHPIIIQVSGALYSAAKIADMSPTKIAALNGHGVQAIRTASSTITMTAKQALAFEQNHIAIDGPPGLVMKIADSAAHLEALTAKQIRSLRGLGVTSLAATDGGVSFGAGESEALLAAGISLRAADSTDASETFANGSMIETVFGSDGAKESVARTHVNGSFDIVSKSSGSFHGVDYTAIDAKYSATDRTASVTFENGAGHVVAAERSTAAGAIVVTVGGVVVEKESLDARSGAFLSSALLSDASALSNPRIAAADCVLFARPSHVLATSEWIGGFADSTKAEIPSEGASPLALAITPSMC